MSASSPNPAQPPARISSIDGLRGVFLVLMTITHVTVPGGSILKAIHPDTVSFIDSATGFVFLSGLMAGLVYSRIAARRGMAAAARRMGVRALQLYGYSVALVLALAAAGLLAPWAARSWTGWAGPLVTPDYRAVTAAVLLLQEASFADVLPMYAAFLLVGVLALWLCLTGRTAAVLATSVLVWAVAQAGATVPATRALAHALTAWRADLSLPDAFNFLGWQILFVAGLALGAASAQGRLQLDAIFRPQATYLVWLSLVGAALITAATLGLRLHHPAAWAPGSIAWLIDQNTGKERLAIGCLLNFAVFAYPTAWLLVAGPQARSVVLKPVALAFGAAVNWRFFRLLGRHSLQVYAWQVVVIYALKVLGDRLGASNAWLNAALILGCVALLAAPAIVRERLRRAGTPPADKAEGSRPTSGQDFTPASQG